MPFGLQGAPATFQQMMDRVTNSLEDFAAAYIDDVVIHIRQVLSCLRKAGLTAKPRKCQFALAQCVYLGRIVVNGEVRPEKSKVDSITSFQTPRTKKEIRCFLGLTGYYRKFISDLAAIAAPLSDLVCKNRPNTVEWSQECEQAFATLKALMCTTPNLQSPGFSKEFILQTDASDRGVGAILSQRDGDGCDHPTAYSSQKLLPREDRFCTIEKERLAIKLGTEAFRVCRFTRWSLSLEPFQFRVKYHIGKMNSNADALSRFI